MVVGNLVPARQGFEVRVVGDHRSHIHGQLADALTVEQVIEAVIGLGDHDHHLGPVLGRGQFEEHAKGIAAFGQAGTKAGFIKARRLAELDPDKEAPGQAIIERMVLGDIAALLVKVAGDHIHRAEQAGAIGGQNPCIRGAAHKGSSCSPVEG
ncbi:hypothetical protein D3C76_1263700 [compost metagenome]